MEIKQSGKIASCIVLTFETSYIDVILLLQPKILTHLIRF